MTLATKIQNDIQTICNLFGSSPDNPGISTTKIIMIIAIVVFFCVMIQLEYNNAIMSNVIEEKTEEKAIEQFTNRQPDIQPIQISINYAKATDARPLFTNSDYLNTMNDINIQARGLTKETLVPFYQSSFQNITIQEEKYITKFIEVLLDDLNKQNKQPYVNYLKYWLEKSILAKSIPKLEGNMPHTQKNYIIMPVEWFKNPNASTLIHELFHIHQRYNPQDFMKLFEAIGFEYYNKGVNTIKGLDEAVAMTRHNPDGLDLNWILHYAAKTKYGRDADYFFLTAKYPNMNNPSIKEVDYKQYPLERDNSGSYYHMNTKSDHYAHINNSFMLSNNHYHPNEIVAQYAEYYLEDSLVDRNYPDKTKHYGEEYKIFLNWMNKQLGYPDIFSIN